MDFAAGDAGLISNIVGQSVQQWAPILIPARAPVSFEPVPGHSGCTLVLVASAC